MKQPLDKDNYCQQLISRVQPRITLALLRLEGQLIDQFFLQCRQKQMAKGNEKISGDEHLGEEYFENGLEIIEIGEYNLQRIFLNLQPHTALEQIIDTMNNVGIIENQIFELHRFPVLVYYLILHMQDQISIQFQGNCIILEDVARLTLMNLDKVDHNI